MRYGSRNLPRFIGLLAVVDEVQSALRRFRSDPSQRRIRKQIVLLAATDIRVHAREPALYDILIGLLSARPQRDAVRCTLLVDRHGMISKPDIATQTDVMEPVRV